MGSLDKNLPAPLYHQLECVLRRVIESGEYQAGQQLPNEGQLAQCFAVSKITVRLALHELANHGYVRREQGRGTFVSRLKLDQRPHELLGFSEEIERRHLTPATKVLKIDVIKADVAIAGPLELGTGGKRGAAEAPSPGRRRADGCSDRPSAERPGAGSRKREF
jgi:GntR family transcriptional regulator